MRHRTPARGGRKRAATGETATQDAIALDYPQEGEVITSPTYTFRISAIPESLQVQVCIDKGPWSDCRRDGGHWWYDWSGYRSGDYRLRARMHDEEGRTRMTLLRRFKVAKPM